MRMVCLCLFVSDRLHCRGHANDTTEKKECDLRIGKCLCVPLHETHRLSLRVTSPLWLARVDSIVLIYQPQSCHHPTAPIIMCVTKVFEVFD